MVNGSNGKVADVRAVIQLVCKDQRGIVHRLSNFVAANNANIIAVDFHNDDTSELFLGRLEFSLDGFAITDRLDSYGRDVRNPS
jgi:formyltetrahydrofolate deformylase